LDAAEQDVGRVEAGLALRSELRGLVAAAAREIFYRDAEALAKFCRNLDPGFGIGRRVEDDGAFFPRGDNEVFVPVFFLSLAETCRQRCEKQGGRE
jgi:hypothetical protein